MAEFPALPLFTDAYLGDTTHLSTIEHGAYLLLLMVAWRSKESAIPDDDAKLAKYCKMTRGQWVRISPTIREFFTEKDGLLYQSRLTDEAKHVRQVRESQRENGRASALKRKGRHSTEREPSESQASTPSPTPTPTISSGDKSPSPRARRAKLAEKPDGVSDDVWRDFLTHRKEKGAPVTETALAGIVSQAAKAGWSLEAALRECCERGWQGFKAEWVKDSGNGRNQQGSHNGNGRVDGFTRALNKAASLYPADDHG